MGSHFHVNLRSWLRKQIAFIFNDETYSCQQKLLLSYYETYYHLCSYPCFLACKCNLSLPLQAETVARKKKKKKNRGGELVLSFWRGLCWS